MIRYAQVNGSATVTAFVVSVPTHTPPRNQMQETTKAVRFAHGSWCLCFDFKLAGHWGKKRTHKTNANANANTNTNTQHTTHNTQKRRLQDMVEMESDQGAGVSKQIEARHLTPHQRILRHHATAT
eukprot:1161780-Rhodomonas_salina.1